MLARCWIIWADSSQHLAEFGQTLTKVGQVRPNLAMFPEHLFDNLWATLGQLLADFRARRDRQGSGGQLWRSTWAVSTDGQLRGQLERRSLGVNQRPTTGSGRQVADAVAARDILPRCLLRRAKTAESQTQCLRSDSWPTGSGRRPRIFGKSMVLDLGPENGPVDHCLGPGAVF